MSATDRALAFAVALSLLALLVNQSHAAVLPSAPSVLSVSYGNVTGTTIIVDFGNDTDRGGADVTGMSLPICELILDAQTFNGLGEESACGWQSDTRFVIQFDGYSDYGKDSSISFRQDGTGLNGRGIRLKGGVSQPVAGRPITYNVSIPSDILQPSAVIRGHRDTVGCNSLNINGLYSIGRQLQYSWKIYNTSDLSSLGTSVDVEESTDRIQLEISYSSLERLRLSNPFAVKLRVWDIFGRWDTATALISRKLEQPFLLSTKTATNVSVDRKDGVAFYTGIQYNQCSSLSSKTVRISWTQFSGPSLPSRYLPVNSGALILPGSLLKIYESYGFTATATIRTGVSTTFSQSLNFTANILARPLSLSITGGNRKVSISDQVFLINARTGTVDPEGEDASVEYTWTCSTSDGGPCPPGMQTVLDAHSAVNGTVVLPISRSAEVGETYQIDVEASKSQRTASVSFFLRVVNETVLPIEIHQPRMGLQKVGPTTRVRLQARVNIPSRIFLQKYGNCSGHATEETVDRYLQYQWSSDSEDVALDRVSTTDSRLILPEGTFPGIDKMFAITVEVSYCNASVSGTSTWKIRGNDVPTGGVVRVYPKSGTQFDKFNIFCIGWLDFDLPMSWRYYAKAGPDDDYELLSFVSSQEPVAYLPVSKYPDHRVILRVEVRDGLGDYFTYEKTVYVEPFNVSSSLTSPEAMAEVEEIATGILDEAESAQDLDTLFQATRVMGSLLDSTETLTYHQDDESIIAVGGGECTTHANCSRGLCISGSCSCNEYWAGSHCAERAKDACADSGCDLAHGYCTRDGHCQCKPTWTGSYCNVTKQWVCNQNNLCKNGGTCLSDGSCACPEPYAGATCELTENVRSLRQALRLNMMTRLKRIQALARGQVDTDPQFIRQQAKTLVLLTKDPSELPPVVQQTLLDEADDLLAKLESTIRSIPESEDAAPIATDVGGTLLQTLSNVLSLSSTSNETSNSTDTSLFLSQLSNVVHRLSNLLMTCRVPGETLEISTPKIIWYAARVDSDHVAHEMMMKPTGFDDEYLDAQSVSFEMSSSIMSHAHQMASNKEMDMEVLTFSDNPFPTSNDSRVLSSRVSSLVIKETQNGTEVSMHDLSEMIEIKMPLWTVSCESDYGVSSCRHYEGVVDVDTCGSVACDDVNAHCLNDTDSGLHCECNAGFIPANISDPNPVCVPGCLIEDVELNVRSDRCGNNGHCGPDNVTCICDHGFYGPDCRFEAQCSFFNVTTGDWSTEGCEFRAFEESEEGILTAVCACNHLTSFGTFRIPQILLPKFSILKTFSDEDLPVLMIMLSILAIYAIAAIYGHKRDQREHLMVIPFLLHRYRAVQKRLAEQEGEIVPSLSLKEKVKAFPRKLLQNLREGHMLFSYYFKPRTDTYSRPQRATVISCTILGTLAVDALLSNAQLETVTDFIIIGLIAGSIVFPMCYVIRFLFAHCKPLVRLEVYPTTSSPQAAKEHWRKRKIAGSEYGSSVELKALKGSSSVRSSGPGKDGHRWDDGGSLGCQGVVVHKLGSRYGSSVGGSFVDIALSHSHIDIRAVPDETEDVSTATDNPSYDDSSSITSSAASSVSDDGLGGVSVVQRVDVRSPAKQIFPIGSTFAPASILRRPSQLRSDVEISIQDADPRQASTVSAKKSRNPISGRTLGLILGLCIVGAALTGYLCLGVASLPWAIGIFIGVIFFIAFMFIMKFAYVIPRRRLGYDERFLPHWMVYVTYCISTLFQIFGCVSIVAYGVQFQDSERSNWLWGSMFGISNDFFILEPVFIGATLFIATFMGSRLERLWNKLLSIYSECAA